MTKTDSEIWRASLLPTSHEIQLSKLDGLPGSEELASAVYTTIRTYQRSSGTAKYLNLSDHIQRLARSLSSENIYLSLDQQEMISLLKVVEKQTGVDGELRIKMIVAPDPDPSCIFVVERLTTPGAECYSKGVDVVTTQYVRNAPEVKAYAFVEKQEQIRSQIEPHIEEVLMVNGDGEILEGLSSNFFGVINPQIFTAEKQILEGITRKIVIDLIYDKGYPLIFNPVCISQLSELTECFITSTSRGILPVRKIDQKVIGSGKPGPITHELMALYSQKLPSLIEPL